MLRKFRLSIATLFFSLTLLTFWGGEQLGLKLAPVIIKFQFIPSLLPLMSPGHFLGLSLAGLIILTALFGRFYCAALCPLGIWQDIIIFFRRLSSQRQRFRLLPDFSQLRYSILIIAAVATAAGSLAWLNLLDPYSIFGRFATEIGYPLLAQGNFILVTILESFDWYAIEHMKLPVMAWGTFSVVSLMLIVLVLLPILGGRVYCNTLCPVGTFLGLISRFALFQFTIRQESCTACGKCTRECRAGCIDAVNKQIDASRCVVCFDCLSSCPQSGLTYEFVSPLAESPQTELNPVRRRFLIGSLASAGAVVGLSIPLRKLAQSFSSDADLNPIMPPGAQSFDHFTDRCTACHLCLAACPTKVIAPAYLAYGWAGIMQPVLNYHHAFCSFECQNCTQVCPTGALQPTDLIAKRRIKIGRVHFYEEYCVVHVNGKDCGACAEVCPTHAVHMVQRDKLFYPETNQATCVGCGACENVCPTTPKSIVVSGLRVHEQAAKPLSGQEQQTQPLENIPAADADFPF